MPSIVFGTKLGTALTLIGTPHTHDAPMSVTEMVHKRLMYGLGARDVAPLFGMLVGPKNEICAVNGDGAMGGETEGEAEKLPAVGSGKAVGAGFAPNTPATTRQPGPRHRRRWAIACAVLALLTLLVPSALAVSSATQDYAQLKALGVSGLQHILAAKDDLLPPTTTANAASSCGAMTAARQTTPAATPATSGTTIPSPAAVQHAQAEFVAAQGDFSALRARLQHPDWVLAAGGSVPGVSSKLATVSALANAGYDIATMGAEFTGAAQPLLARVHGGGLTGGSELLTESDVTSMQHTMDDATRLLTDVQSQVRHVNMGDLPICATQKAEFSRYLGELPHIRDMLSQGDQLLGTASWLLGVDAPRHFLVQTLDRAELRPSGGFTGDYGIVTIQNGKIGAFTLNDIDQLDYKTGFAWTVGRRPPDAYSWWPFEDWGMRDANLSADFPTNARMVLDVYHNEGGDPVDGLINISPTAIAHVLRVTGPIAISDYGETITADNLEDRLHYYQQDPAGIAKEQALSPGDDSIVARKRFTQLVGKLLQERVRALPMSQMLPLAKQLLADLQSKDIEAYSTNPKVEDLLRQRHADGAIDTTPGIDGFTLVQANVSVAKSTPYVKLVEHDDVSLDVQGGATHHLTVSMQYTPTGNVYGYTTYRDYVRIYTPANAQLLSADGFDSNRPLCWAPPPNHPTIAKPDMFASVPGCSSAPYPNGELTCPAGFYGPGNQAPSIFGSDGRTPWTLDALAGPTATTSDVAGRTMWGGYVVIPPYCTETLSLSWHVADVAAPSSAVPASAKPYTLLVQRQSGTAYEARVSIHPATPGGSVAHFDATISQNVAFTLGKPQPVSTP